MYGVTQIDRSRSLQELEGSDWGDPETAETPMISRILSLRRKPLRELTDGEIRLAVGQRVGLPFILELAMERLRPNPLVASDCYPGDILGALVRLDEEDWAARGDLRGELAELFRQAIDQSGEDAEAFRDSLQLPSGGHGAN